MFYSNVGIDMKKVAAQDRAEYNTFMFERAEAEATQAAMIDEFGGTNQSADVVDFGSEAHVRHEFSWDQAHSSESMNRKVGIQRIRKARERGKLHRAQMVRLPGGQLRTVCRDEYEAEAERQGIFCWKCREAKPDTIDEIVEKHQRLADFTNYSPPVGVSLEDLCCFCGAKLGGTTGV